MEPGKETEKALMEVRSFELGEIDRIPLTEEGKDSAVEAYKLISKYKALERMANGAVAALVKEFASTAQVVERHKRWGGENTAAFDHLQGGPLRAARKFEKFAKQIVSSIESIIILGGMKPRHEEVEGEETELAEAIDSGKKLAAFIDSNMKQIQGRVADLKAGRDKGVPIESLESTLKAMLNGIAELKRSQK